MIKVIFICSGNICRSAMAKGYLEKRLEELKISDEVEVTSAGTKAQEGQVATDFAREAIKEYGVDIDLHKATHVSQSNILEADYIIVMTKEHKTQLLELYKNNLEIKSKISLLKEFVQNKGYMNVDDPWGFDIDIYKGCAEKIVKSVDMLLEQLQKIIKKGEI